MLRARTLVNGPQLLWRLCAGLGLLLLSSTSAFAEGACARIVSLAPSITEVAFELGLGDQVVGVTRYCRYPKQAQAKARVGGYLDLSLEAVLRLKPTVVFLLAEQESVARRFEALGIRVQRVDHSGLQGLHASVRMVGSLCGVESAAQALLGELDRKVKEVQAQVPKGQKRPLRVLVLVGGQVRGGKPSDLYVSGKDGYYSDLLRLLGAENVFAKETAVFSAISLEGMRQLNPDFVVHVVSSDDAASAQAMREAWASAQFAPLLKDRTVLVLDDDFASVPGPRYPQLLMLLQKKIYEG